VNDNITPDGGEKVILTANIQGSTDTKVSLTPAADENGNPIVKAEWEESGEKFKVYGMDEEGGPNGNSPTWFTQIDGTNQFEGTLPVSATGNYCAVYGDDLESTNMPLQYELDEQDATLYQRNEYYSTVLMGAEFSGSSASLTFEHITAILKPTFKVDGNAINNTITQIVMSGVVVPTTALPGHEEITIAPTSPATTLADDIYIHLPVVEPYTNHEFTFSVTAGGKSYTASLTIPEGKFIEAGNLYTADIKLTEKVTYAYLPDGAQFNEDLCSLLDANENVTAIEFVGQSSLEGTDVAYGSFVNLYYKIVGNTLQLHTRAHKFRFSDDCSGMFQDYGSTRMSEITSIKFNDCIYTSDVMNMSDMFSDCQALNSLDLSSFNTAKVTTMAGMFSDCQALESLDLSSFNTSKVTDMINMFASSGLQSITFGELFNTSNVTTMLRMFENCSDLTTIDFSGFDTSNVTSMTSMFSGCSSLTTLNLSAFTAEKMGGMYMMFNDCINLEELNLQNFVPATTKQADYMAMFRNVGSRLPSGSKTKIYVAAGNPFEEYISYVSIDAEKTECIEEIQNN
jgi:surface protein